MSEWAQFWEVDLHVHTPASADVQPDTYGADSPEEIVRAATAAGLDAIAITDHNTSSWCDPVALAARDSSLIVLPGVEISTTEGHLLAIWEEATPSRVINELLVRLGIGNEDQGKLDIAAEVGFKDAAKEIFASNGVAVAAHVDRPRGLLKLPVAAHLKRTLLEECLVAVEVADLETVATVAAKVSKERTLACIRGSDVGLPQHGFHILAGIGHRRTWVKAARPDLVGLKHAFNDPDIRLRLEAPPVASHPTIESVAVSGGFLDGQRLEFSPDLNCLLGGTGAGKSLVIEAIRYAVEQQVDSDAFPAIWKEVQSRLAFTMGNTGVVRIVVQIDSERYSIERAFDTAGESVATVANYVNDDWVTVDVDSAALMPISAFSQGEVLEYAREPVGRMNLVDSGIDLTEVYRVERQLCVDLRKNGSKLLAQRRLVSELNAVSAKKESLEERVRELSTFFDTDLVKQQEGWKAEAAVIAQVLRSIPSRDDVSVEVPEGVVESRVSGNADLFLSISEIRAALGNAIARQVQIISESIVAANSQLSEVQNKWKERFETFKSALDAELEQHGDGTSLVTLRAQLEQLQGQLVEARQKGVQLEQIERPRLSQLTAERESLLSRLQEVRDERRQLRRDRADALNGKTAGIVKLDISAHPDSSAFRAALGKLKTGSRVRDDVLDAIGSRVHPFRFVRCLMQGDTPSLVNDAEGIDASSIARFFASIDERNLWADLLEAQACPMPDRLDIKFCRPDDQQYVSIERLAHGQKCTAVLVVLLADGDSPVVVDQPEDALHAPWIEDYLVDRLRGLRGQRQYIFATRSPGLVVGADAEQIITMKASSGRGEIEARGSLERYDLNRLTLYHLEGGAMAFRRRSGKLDVSVNTG